MPRIKRFDLPDLGEGLTEGEILKWLVDVGDDIELNQPLVEVETAKAAVEIPAKWAGRVKEIFYPEGAVVEVGAAMVSIDTDPGAPDEPAADGQPSGGQTSGGQPDGPVDQPARTPVLVGYGPRTAAAKRRPRKSLTGATSAPTEVAPPTATQPPPPAGAPLPSAGAPLVSAGAPLPSAAAPLVSAEAPLPSATPGSTGGGPVLAKPPVRKLARDLGVDLHTVPGSGPLGSVTRQDVQRAAETAAAWSPADTGTTDWSSAGAQQVADWGAAREKRIPVRGVRKLTAQNMVASAFSAPHVTEFLTVDVTRSIKALERLRGLPGWQEVRVSPLLLVAKAVLLGVRRYPLLNSSWDGDQIVVKEYVNLGIAAATERGLIVPNVKDAARLSLHQLAAELNTLVQTARAGRTTPAEMSAGTFTITNVGVFGVDSGTPILPPGEAAILAFGAVRELPWVHKGKIRKRQVTTLSLSFDHRIIDGEVGSKFLRDVGGFLADPETAMLAWC